MTGKVFFGFVSFLLIGIFIGWSLSSMAYKPILMAQAQEIYYIEKEKIKSESRINLLEVEIEAHNQDMAQFISKSTLMKLLDQLGIYGQQR